MIDKEADVIECLTMTIIQRVFELFVFLGFKILLNTMTSVLVVWEISQEYQFGFYIGEVLRVMGLN